MCRESEGVKNGSEEKGFRGSFFLSALEGNDDVQFTEIACMSMSFAVQTAMPLLP